MIVDKIRRQEKRESVTVQDVAKAAQVSVGTVSRVFNNNPNVAEDLKQRVLKTAGELGYVGLAGQHAQSPHPKTLKEILFLHAVELGAQDISIASDPYWSQMLRGVESEARKSNIKLTYKSIVDTSRLSSLLPTHFNEKRQSGVLLITPHYVPDQMTDLIQQLQAINVAVVLIDNVLPDQPVDCVLADNFGGARQVVDHLISEGHREIAFIGVPMVARPGRRPVCISYTVNQREEGYRMALIDADLPVKDELYEPGDLTPEGGYAACKRLLERQAKFTAIFCVNDNMAIGAMKALREANLLVPDNISLAGFDDIDIVQHLAPPLTSVRYSKEAIGATAVRKLIWRANDAKGEKVVSLVRVELIKRTSVSPRQD